MDYGYLDKAITNLNQADGLIGQILDNVAAGEILEVSSGDSGVLKRKIEELRETIEKLEQNLESAKKTISDNERMVTTKQW